MNMTMARGIGLALLAAAAKVSEAQVKEDLAAIRVDEKVLADPASAAMSTAGTTRTAGRTCMPGWRR